MSAEGAGSGGPAAPGLPPRYEVQRFLGQGAMGRVFLCRDLELDVLVALKVLAPQYAEDPGSVDQVRAEARAVAKFRGCPSILALYGFERHEGTWYLVTEFAAGGSLDHRLKREGRLSEEECRRIGAEVAEALQFAHQGLVLHRDIKPANVLLDDKGRAKVADFGIAKILRADTREASTMTLTGTPVYMSPEAILREPMDARSDLYSLGCMLFEMGTGRRPFSGSHFEVFLSKTADNAVPPDPKEFAPDLSDAFCAIIRRAMAKSPDGRFPNCLTMAAALRDVTADEEQATILSMASAGKHLPAPPALVHDGVTMRELPPSTPAPPAAPPPPARETAPRPVVPPAPLPETGAGHGARSAEQARRAPVVPIVIGAVVLVAAAGIGGWLLLGGKGGKEKPTEPAVADGGGKGPAKTAPSPPSKDPNDGAPVKSNPDPKPPEPPEKPEPKKEPKPGAPPQPPPAPPPAPTVTAIAPAVELPAPKDAAAVDAAILPKGFRLQDGRVFCEKDRAEMVLVPAGKFVRGSDSGLPDEKPQKEIRLKAFLIDRHEVTVGQWNEYARDARREDLLKPATDPRLPVVDVFHDDASAYAAWAGKRLPTEAEWEKAARGEGGRSRPWGDSEDKGAAHAGRGKGPEPVGRYPRDESPCGALDMAGNVAEWCSDWYEEKYYGSAKDRDPTGPGEGTMRVFRGGAFSLPADMTLLYRRNFGKTGKDFRKNYLGFRCAADVRGP